ncbi:MAG: dihydroorotate dehydrogenase [Acidimicrobiaceae bacterium]|nr:dihydroorotate dehydrogenase [Acidimicrobiaceae bacterium]MCY4279720.1 dihydroorotate dehydrogenase [Acidimicrobiaceae bacterium]MCY4293962.1 dihydroorotate dehydrogenase [Acidimicrobiaceae bacterium]
MVDLTASVGSVTLRAPVMTASGTSGHGAELAGYGRLSELGAVVVKSLSDEPWPGNPAPRLHPLSTAAAGMINSVGLQGPGIAHWLEHDLPELLDSGATVIASIWGGTVDSYRRAAGLLAHAPAEVAAVEVNVSCPNTDDGMRMFAHSADATAAAVEAAAGCGRPRWAKLSPNTFELTDVAAAAVAAGAAGVVLANTLSGMVIDIDKRRPALGARRGGVSGAALRPVAVRAVYDVRAALPAVPIVGVGGVGRGTDAVEMIMAGASAVQVGTAIFADPRAPWRVLHELRQWCEAHGVQKLDELIGAAHEP